MAVAVELGCPDATSASNFTCIADTTFFANASESTVASARGLLTTEANFDESVPRNSTIIASIFAPTAVLRSDVR